MQTTKTILCRVVLSPKLQEVAGLMTAAQRRMMAKGLRKDARQLEVSARIMEIDRRRAYEGRPQRDTLPLFPVRLLPRN